MNQLNALSNCVEYYDSDDYFLEADKDVFKKF